MSISSEIHTESAQYTEAQAEPLKKMFTKKLSKTKNI